MVDESKCKGTVCILDYGMGNLRSVLRAFEKVGARARIVSKQQEVIEGSGLIFPGQGSLPDCMKRLKSTGWDLFIKEWVEQNKPFFGICLGLQALFEHSEEGNTEGLGLMEGTVKRFSFSLDSGFKIPHMGWNAVRFRSEENPALLDGISVDNDQFYFVHSYYANPNQNDVVWGTTEYGGLEFCSAVRSGNVLATQFHPEKSQFVGLKLYENFLKTLPQAESIRSV